MNLVTFTGTVPTAGEIVGLLAEHGFDVGEARPVSRTFLDTFDGRLHTAGMRLELRRDPALELMLHDAQSAAHLTVTTQPRFVDDLPAGPFRARLAPLVEMRALLPVVSVTAQETVAVRRDPAGKAVARVVVDDKVVANGEPLATWTAELTELDGYAGPGQRTRQLLESIPLQRADGHVLGVAAEATGVALQGFIGSPTVPLAADTPAIDGFKVVLANLADAIEANWDGAVDDIDSEFLHDLRVAVRRTRSVLSHGKRIVPAEIRMEFRERFAWLGAATGPARDLDVYVLEWDRYVQPLPAAARAALAPVLGYVRQEQQQAHDTLARELNSARATTIMPEWRAWLGSGTSGAGADAAAEADQPLGHVVGRRITQAQQGLLTRGRPIRPDTPADDVHELRKDAKKLRYLLECFGGLYPAKPRRAFVKRLKALQENLGAHQDAVVHVEQLDVIAASLPPASTPTATFVAIGRLTEHLEQHRLTARREFAERFAAYDAKPTRQALNELLAT